jgi:hypothetical protein
VPAYGYAAVNIFRVSVEAQNMLNLVISALIAALQLLWRLLSRLMSLLGPDEFARVAQTELRSLDAALGGFLLIDPQMNWMRRNPPGLHH